MGVDIRLLKAFGTQNVGKPATVGGNAINAGVVQRIRQLCRRLRGFGLPAGERGLLSRQRPGRAQRRHGPADGCAAMRRLLLAALLALIAPASAPVHVHDVLNPAPFGPGRAR